MKSMNIEFRNGRLLFIDKVKSYDLRCTQGGSVGVLEIEKEDGTTVLMNWDHLLFASYKEDKDNGEIH